MGKNNNRNYSNQTNSGNKPSASPNNKPKVSANDTWGTLKSFYQKKWISENATPELLKFSEEAGRFMANYGLTNSKIRSIYGELKRIQMGEFEKEKSAFYLLKPKVAYAYGREQNNEGLKLFKLIFDRAWNDVEDQKSFQNFCNFIEAILAYHRAIGGNKVNK